jgi:hypothetical protein
MGERWDNINIQWILPGSLLDGAEKAGVAEGVPAASHVRLIYQLETDGT